MSITPIARSALSGQCKDRPNLVMQEIPLQAKISVLPCRSRSAEAAQKRFGVTDGRSGICYTRTGRLFFDDLQLETEFLERLIPN